jgi:hypothetical protein
VPLKALYYRSTPSTLLKKGLAALPSLRGTHSAAGGHSQDEFSVYSASRLREEEVRKERAVLRCRPEWLQKPGVSLEIRDLKRVVHPK